MTMESGDVDKICLPGARLCVLDERHIPGQGTYERSGHIYASLAGILKTEEDPKTMVKVISVKSLKTPSVLPKTGDIVTAKVLVVNSRVIQCLILCVGRTVLSRSYRGILKKEDIKSIDKDGVDTYKCYRPGDVIIARVLPVTEIHCYHLSTAENELGVVIATGVDSPKDVNMVPTSQSEMQCPKTLIKEPRKVAKNIQESINYFSFHELKGDDYVKIK